MCDETTEAENQAYLAARDKTLSRRDLMIGSGASAVVVGCSPAAPTLAPETPSAAASAAPPEPPPAASETTSPRQTKERWALIETAAGSAEAFFVAPASGRHPGVILWPDVAGLRGAYQTMATRLAQSGYAVLAVNQYYRSSKLPILTEFSQWKTPEGKAKIKPMREVITAQGITEDGARFAAWLDQQPEVDVAKKIGSAGYCMGGPFTFRTAVAAPSRVGAIASFHGGRLVTDEADSPHKLFGQMQAAALICIAQNDDARQPEAKSALSEAAASANIPAEVEVYPAQHGWCTIDSPVFDEPQAERAWSRMLATFEKYL